MEQVYVDAVHASRDATLREAELIRRERDLYAKALRHIAGVADAKTEIGRLIINRVNETLNVKG